MKISLNQIKQYTPVNISDDELIQKIGSQLGGIEAVMPLGATYQGVVIVKVVSCEDHPNADRLHVCMIDDGGVVADVPRNGQGLVQVVCGAPNVTAGVTVAWLPPGTTVPSTYATDPFVLEARELRGVVSNGMLASPKELAIGDSHEGLLLIDEAVAPGTPFAEKFNLDGDTVIDIENKMFTHRPDCFGWLGVAREVAGIQGNQFTSPEWYRSDAGITQQATSGLPLTVRNELPDLVPRFTAITMSNISIEPSPVWLQVQLSRVGIRPINNLVDLTNYYMVLTGQPLHAYDYDKVRAQDPEAAMATLVVRHPRPEEKLQLLSGKEITPRAEAIMIATDTQAIGLGGVMGGATTEVDNNTTNIILECANFDMYSIRRTSMTHGLFTDAVTRFNKGQSPLQTLPVLARIVTDIVDLCGGQVASMLIDDNHLSAEVQERGSLYPAITVDKDFVNARLGTDLAAVEMDRLLQNVECEVATDGNQLTVTAPFWRTDIEIPEDIVEEVGRLYGYDHLPLTLPQRPIRPTLRDYYQDLKTDIRASLSRAGANEILTYSFVHGKTLDKAGQDKAGAYTLSNALSPELQYFRLSLTPSLLDKVHANSKAGYDKFALFEIGKTHVKGDSDYDEPELPEEKQRVGFVYAAQPKAVPAKAGAAYYEAQNYLQQLFRMLGLSISKLTLQQLPEDTNSLPASVAAWLAPYDSKRSAMILYTIEQSPAGGTLFGVVGELKASVKKAFKLPDYTAAFEFDVALLGLGRRENTDEKYLPLSKYPSVTQDISLRVASEVPYANVAHLVNKALRESAPNLTVDVQPIDIYQQDQTKNLAFRITVVSYEQTLTDTKVSELLDAVAAAAREQLSAERL